MTKGTARAAAWAKENRKKIAIGAGCSVIFVALIVVFCVHGCSDGLGGTGDNACDHEEAVITKPSQDGAVINSEKEKSNPDQATGQSAALEPSKNCTETTSSAQAESPDNARSESTDQTGDQAEPTQQANGGASATESNDSGSTSSGTSSSESDPTPQKRWVADYENVWVEDSAAWTEQVPIYGCEERSICNVCGADITGCEASHGKQHMLAGEGSGHHSESVQTITGYTTVNHAAQGHWETIASGGHWE